MPQNYPYSKLLRRRRDLWKHRAKIEDPALHREFEVLSAVNNKVRGYRWVADNGGTVVRHGIHADARTAMAQTTADRFVIKVVCGHSSKGVYLLERAGTGFDCRMTERTFASSGEVVEALEKDRQFFVAGSTVADRRFLVEEYVEDSLGYDVPLDYKVYAFAAGCPIVMQRYAPSHLPKSEWKFAFYDRDGTDLGPIRNNTAHDPASGLRPPADLAAIFDEADRLIQVAGVSFLRIDMYSTPDGPVFGEFTPVPNNAKESFDAPCEALLGRYWTDSLEKLSLTYL